MARIAIFLFLRNSSLSLKKIFTKNWRVFVLKIKWKLIKKKVFVEIEEVLYAKSSEHQRKKKSSPQFETKFGRNVWDLFLLPGPFLSVQPALKPWWGDAEFRWGHAKSRWGMPNLDGGCQILMGDAKSRWGDANFRWRDASLLQFKYCLQVTQFESTGTLVHWFRSSLLQILQWIGT